MEINRLYRYAHNLTYEESVATQPTLEVKRLEADTETTIKVYSMSSHWATIILTPAQARQLARELQHQASLADGGVLLDLEED